MTITGIADEAAKDIDGQIRAHQALGWDTIELRLIDGQNVAGPLDDATFDEAAMKLADAGMTVTAFASAIGNWSRPITGDFDLDRRDLEVAIARMDRLGVKFIRTMSWVGEGVDDAFWHDEGVRRYKHLAELAEQADIYLAYENCTGWGEQSADHMTKFIDDVGSDHVVMLYDLGNVIGLGMPDCMAFYEAVRPYVRYVHIKDAHRAAVPGDPVTHAFPGEGDAMIPELLRALLASGYDGVFSIEPHIATVIHDPARRAGPEQMYEAYIRYGRMAMDLVAQARQ